jgi:DNA-binding transcriptional ArsR family regulator
MATRVVVHGQEVWSNQDHRRLMMRPSAREGANVRRSRLMPDPVPIDVAGAIQPDSVDSPFRVGVGYFDSEEQVAYRVVRSGMINWTDGWATIAFWRNRWKLSVEEVFRLTRAGLLDAAMEDCSQVRRYRCRDEQKVLAHPVVTQAHAKAKMLPVTQAKIAKAKASRPKFRP